MNHTVPGDKWLVLSSLICLIVLTLAVGRGLGELPPTLILSFLGLALWGCTGPMDAMGGINWFVIGPYLLLMGFGFGLDLRNVDGLFRGSMSVGLLVVGLLAPFSHRVGVDQLWFFFLAALYGSTVIQRPHTPPREAALMFGAVITRLAFVRVVRLQRVAPRVRSVGVHAILAPAVRSAFLAVLLILASDALIGGGRDLLERFEPGIKTASEKLRRLPGRIRRLGVEARKWVDQVLDGQPSPEGKESGESALLETLLSGQTPDAPARIDSPGRVFFKISRRNELDFGRGLKDPLPSVSSYSLEPLARVRTQPRLRWSPYLRRGAYDFYDVGRWSYPQPEWEPWTPEQIFEGEPTTEVWLKMKPGVAGELLVPCPLADMLSPVGLEIDRGRNLRAPGISAGKLVTLRAVMLRFRPDSAVEARVDLPARLYRVPNTISDDPTFQRAVKEARRYARKRGGSLPVAVAEWVGTHHWYSRKPRHDARRDPTLEFLRTRVGFCQHMASLAALILRAQGVPARIGAGLAFGTLKNGEWVYLASNAHAWVELPAVGGLWSIVDPTAYSSMADPSEPRPPGIGAAEPRIKRPSGNRPSAKATGGPSGTKRGRPDPLLSGQNPVSKSTNTARRSSGAARRGSDSGGKLAERGSQPSHKAAGPRASRPPDGDAGGKDPLPSGRASLPEEENARPARRSSRVNPAPVGAGKKIGHRSGQSTGPGRGTQGQASASSDGESSTDSGSSGGPGRGTQGQASASSGREASTDSVSSGGPGRGTQGRKELVAIPAWKRVEEFLGGLALRVEWILLIMGASVLLVAVWKLGKREKTEQLLGERPPRPEDAPSRLEKLRELLPRVTDSSERVKGLFDIFCLQLAVWGVGRRSHETEREYAVVVGQALGAGPADDMEVVASVLEEVLYGDLEPSPKQLERYEQSVRGVASSLARRMGVSVIPELALGRFAAWRRSWRAG